MSHSGLSITNRKSEAQKKGSAQQVQSPGTSGRHSAFRRVLFYQSGDIPG